MSSNLDDFLTKQQNKNLEDTIWCYLVTLSRLHFTKLAFQEKTDQLEEKDLPLLDFNAAHLLLKKLKERFTELSQDEKAQAKLFGEKDKQAQCQFLIDTVDKALIAFHEIDCAIKIDNISSALALTFAAAIVVTTVLAILSTFMPWFVPLALFAGLCVTALAFEGTNSHFIQNAKSTLSTIDDRLTLGEKPHTSNTLSDRHMFFSQKCFPSAIKHIGVTKADEIISAHEKHSSRASYVPRDIRRNGVIADMRATERRAGLY